MENPFTLYDEKLKILLDGYLNWEGRTGNGSLFDDLLLLLE